MASLAAKDTINPEEEMDDEENKAFEIDMLTAHAEETFIDNLKSLKTKNLFKETILLQSLHNDAVLLQNSPILAVKSETLRGLTPFDYINNLGEEWGEKYDIMVDETSKEIQKLKKERDELNTRLSKFEKEKEQLVIWNKKKRDPVVTNLIDELKSEISKNTRMEQKLTGDHIELQNNFDTLKAIAMICNHVEMNYNSQKAREELLASEEERGVKAAKKKKKKKKKKKEPAVVTQEEKAKIKPMDLKASKIEDPEDTPEEEITAVSNRQEEDKESEEPKKEPVKEDVEEANILIDKIVELFSYLKEKGIYKKERKKRKATFGRAEELQEKLKEYFKKTFIPLLKENNLNFIITGGYATRLLSGGNYITDDIDVKIQSMDPTDNTTIEKLRDKTIEILNTHPPEGLNAFFKFFNRAKTPEEKKNGNIPFKITAPINIGEYHDQDMGEWIPISEITFTTQPYSPNDIQQVEGFNVLSPKILINNLLSAIGSNYKERIETAKKLRAEKKPAESIYPGKVLSWFWQLQQLLYMVYPSFKKDLETRIKTLSIGSKTGGKKTKKTKKKKRKTYRKKYKKYKKSKKIKRKKKGTRRKKYILKKKLSF